VVEPSRLRRLAERAVPRGRFVLYWMQRAQRVAGNHALEFAIAEANRLALPVVVGFGLMDDYPEANERHYAFMLQGLREVATGLAERGIGFVLRLGSPERVAAGLAQEAALLVCDRGYLRHEKRWRAGVAAAVPCPVIEVETDVVVPVDRVSDKAETAARTIRPKLMRLLDEFLHPVEAVTPARPSIAIAPASDLDPRDGAGLLRRLRLDRSTAPVPQIAGGASAARQHLDDFVSHRLGRYAAERAEPAAGIASRLSPYLHFGQISPIDIALRVRDAGDPANASVFIEELIVRRELAINFVNFTPDYDGFAALPAWARQTLSAHAGDKRPALYDDAQLVAAATDDRYWNAAMTEMTLSGTMPNHMRMYWGKKVLEWSEKPEEAHRRLLTLNNRYFLDGRDANSFANVGWILGLHDRPWPERPVFGTVRSMTARGLERKFDIETYVDAVGHLKEAHHPARGS
jgi:deoxyribodipyrimidine photo-lyase